MIATIDTANVRISKTMILWPEASFSMAVFDKSSVTVVSDALISCRLFVNAVVEVLSLYGSANLDSQICYLKGPIKREKYGTPGGTIFQWETFMYRSETQYTVALVKVGLIGDLHPASNLFACFEKTFVDSCCQFTVFYYLCIYCRSSFTKSIVDIIVKFA